MQKFEFSVVLHNNDQVTRDMKVEFVSASEGKYQPVITVNDGETGFSTVTKLPISDYAALRSKLDQMIGQLDADGVQNLVRKVTTFLSLVR